MSNIDENQVENFKTLLEDIKKSSTLEVKFNNKDELTTTINSYKVENGMLWYSEFNTDDDVGIPLSNIDEVRIIKYKV